MAMKKLSVEVRSILSSSLQINNFKRVVEELVYNSLDAKATSIAVRVDIEENKIQVVDNGCGISENDFDLIGQKYSTSKCIDLKTLKSVPNTYGFRGQFLANLINIAKKVKITSRFDKSEDTWVKIFYDGKERDLARTTTRPSVGTTVEVSGIFYNLHIQSKNVEPVNELNEIKMLLKQLSLIHNNISISLRDDSKNEVVFKAHKNRNIYQTFRMLFNIDEKDIQEFKVSKKEYKVTAYFTKKDEVDIGQYHWIYLNGKFINNCQLHKIVNDALSKSINPFLKSKAKTKAEDNEDVRFTKRNLPFYIILLSCPYYDYDISDLSNHTTLEFRNWQDVTNLLKKLILFYNGDEKFNKQLKCKETSKNLLRPKVSEDDMRDQVRKIVEKLLKSNSKKRGVSQMQNGIKGKLTKRKNTKKDNSLKLSLSKVIPSKNKLIRQCSKDVLKKIEANDEVLSISMPEVKSVENCEIEIEQLKGDRNKNPSIPKHCTENKKGRTKHKRKKDNSKYANIVLKDCGLNKDISLNKQNNTRRNAKNKKNSYNQQSKYEEEKIKIANNANSDFVGSIDIRKFKNNYNAEFYHNFNQNKYDEADMYNCYEKEHLSKENYMTSVCNFTNSNAKITLREKIEEIIIYDYAPHPLNSNQCDDVYNNILKKNSLVSSRDLVKTILSTQHYVSTNEHTDISDNERFQPQRLGRLPNNKHILTTNPEVKRDSIVNIAKDTRGSTFDAWNFNFQSDPHFTNEISDEGAVFTKMTYESHHYNKNICNDKFHNTGIKRTKQFITKQSKDNFLLSIQKKKFNFNKNKFSWHKSRDLYKPKITKKRDVNVTLGIKNFFKSNNFIPGSSFTIEFSNRSENNIIPKTKCQQYDESIFYKKDRFINVNVNNWTLNSRINYEHTDKNSVHSCNKNTYTIDETSLDVRYHCNINNQNFEGIGYTNNLIHGTYTIDTNNEEWSYNCTNNKDEELNKDKATENQNELNIMFISERQMEVAESSDKILEPLDICETVFNDNTSRNKLSDSFASMTYLKNVVNEINRDIVELDKQKILSPNVPLQEVSHHFNTTKSNTNNIAVANKSLITETDLNIQNNYKNDNIPSTINNENIPTNFENKTNDHTDQNITEVNNYRITNRPRFMPKGMSPIFENCNTKGLGDYNFIEEYFEYNIYKEFTNKVQENTEIFKPRVQNATEDTTKAIEKVHTRLHKENSALIFDSKLLKQAQVLGQVDEKFIAGIIKAKSETSDFLVLFDQHAVHERIRLEENMADYFNGQEWKKLKLDEFLLKLSKDEILYLHNYKEKFALLGLDWNILSDFEVSICGIPEAILGKNPRQADKVIAAVKNLVLEEISTIKSQGGCISLHPKSIMDLVFSEACRYAIKFGDKLTISNCRELIQSLSECKTPFQCAHGRPVMAVLMEMPSHHVRDYKIDMTKIRSFSVNKQYQGSNIQK